MYLFLTLLINILNLQAQEQKEVPRWIEEKQIESFRSRERTKEWIAEKQIESHQKMLENNKELVTGCKSFLNNEEKGKIIKELLSEKQILIDDYCESLPKLHWQLLSRDCNDIGELNNCELSHDRTLITCVNGTYRLNENQNDDNRGIRGVLKNS